MKTLKWMAFLWVLNYMHQLYIIRLLLHSIDSMQDHQSNIHVYISHHHLLFWIQEKKIIILQIIFVCLNKRIFFIRTYFSEWFYDTFVYVYQQWGHNQLSMPYDCQMDLRRIYLCMNHNPNIWWPMLESKRRIISLNVN